MDRYDIFISYAHEDSKWVQANLYQPLLRYKLPDGQRPNVFLDTDEIKIGQSWADVLMKAIQETRYFIPVFTRTYFTKPMCEWELKLAWQRDPTGRHSILLPVMLDPAVQVPAIYQLIQYTTVKDDRDWFGELCNQMGITPFAKKSEIRFVNQPHNTTINYTLDRLSVDVYVDGQPSEESHLITLNTTNGRLQGTKSQYTENGRAVFVDLSISEITGDTRLIASTDGCQPIESEVFTVNPPPPLPLPVETITDSSKRDAYIPVASQVPPVFLKDDATIGLFTVDGVMFYSLEGDAVFSKPVPYKVMMPFRLSQTTETSLYLGDWQGTIQVIHKDGSTAIWQVKTDDVHWCIINDLLIGSEGVYVSLWSGAVYELKADSEVVHVFTHEEGVQGLVIRDGRCFVCGFDGKLVVYEKGSRIAGEAQLEAPIGLFHPCGQYLIAIGDKNGFQIIPKTLEVAKYEHPALIAGSLGGINYTTIVDADGKGIQFDSEFIIQSEFHTVKNAVPFLTDTLGKYCVLRNPDGSYTLLVNGKIVFSTMQEALVVSPDGNYFLISNDIGVRILTQKQLKEYSSEAKEDG